MVVGRAICLLSVVVLAEGSEFLGAQTHGAEAISKQEVEQMLFSEVNMDEVTAVKLESELRPLFVTMPKNEFDNLEPSSVRYVLHRYFAQKHGWHMIGLDRAAGAWNTSTPTSILKNEVPSYVEELFEARMKAKGLGLRELAVLAATMSDLIKSESEKEMDYIYSALKFDTSTHISHKDLSRVFRSFLVAKIWGTEEGDAMKNLLRAEKNLEDSYLAWDGTKMWQRDEVNTFQFLRRDSINPFREGYSFDTAVSLASELNHRHSQMHFLECRSLKNQLLELEHQGTGRVSLSDFYSGAAADEWPFVEKKEYLRAIGVLDETNPSRPSVIIQNYLLGPAQCLETSGYYSLCCKDECEDILAQVERALGVPSASPRQIVEAVSSIGSESVHAPRNLSVALTARLEQVAEHHGGEVPLHGRLFAQWLHHAYPQECPFPHVAGTVSHQNPFAWASDHGFADANMDMKDVQAHLKEWSMREDVPEAHVASLPWSSVEELVSTGKRSTRKTGSWLGHLRVMLCFAVLASVAYSMSTRMMDGPSVSKKVNHIHLV